MGEKSGTRKCAFNDLKGGAEVNGFKLQMPVLVTKGRLFLWRCVSARRVFADAFRS